MEDFLSCLDPVLFKNSNDLKISVADGTPQEVLCKICLPVNFQDKTFELRFAVIPTISHPIILGADFCRLCDLKLNFKENSFELASNNINIAGKLTEFSSLTNEEASRLQKIINQFSKLSSKSPGLTNLTEHFIDTGDAKPFKQRQYSFSPALQKILNQEIDKMLAQGVIEPSNSPWSSPIVMVKKKDDSYRMCFDGRKLNEVTVKDSYPLPLIDTILSKLDNTSYLSSIDIASAFWNIPLEKSSKPKTAFQVHGRGLFQFRVMPFGLCNASQTFQRLVDSIFTPELSPYVFCYLDDIIVVSPDFETHLRILEEVYLRLEKAGLSVNLEKCQFCRSSLSFLGFVIDKNGLRTDPSKVESILKTPSPKNTTEVRRLIGILQWYRRFIRDFSTISEPITSLIKGRKKGLPIKWTDEAENAFQLLKERLVSAPILTTPRWDKPFFIQTDASDVGIGAVLFQEDGGFEHPVAYASRKLTKAERKYTVTERECLAVLFGVEKFRGYVEGTPFTVITDHSSLLWLYRLKDPIGRLARWTVRLSQFNFKIIHRKGSQNIMADFLSRSISVINLDEFVPDEWYLNMIEKISKEPEKYPDFMVNDNIIYKHIRPNHDLNSNISEWKIVVPTQNRKNIMEEFHDSPLAAHLGIFKTYSRILEKYYWPGMKKDIRYYVKTCKTCGAFKKPCVVKSGQMGNAKKIEFPFQAISLDLMGPFPRSKKGNTQLLVVTDWFTKFVLVQPMTKATSSNVIKFLENQVFLTFGVPQIIMCDNGVQFTSKDFKNFLDKYSVQKIWYNARYHPQVNPTERVNKVIGTAMASYIKEDHKTWDVEIFKIAQAIRTAVHEVTGYSPAFLVFGRNVPVDGTYYGTITEEIRRLNFEDRQKWHSDLQKLPNLYKKVESKLNKAYETSAHRYNLRRRPVKFNVGDKVWKTNFVLSDATANFSKKLAPKYVPAIIHKTRGSGLVYDLVDLNGKPLGAFHVQDLKPYYDRGDVNSVENSGNKLQDADSLFKTWNSHLKSKSLISFDHVREENMDLFKAPKNFSLAHCVGSDMRMGAGIAVQFKKMFGHVNELRRLKIEPGGLAFIKKSRRYIYYLVTKRFSNGKPSYKNLCSSLIHLRDHMLINNVSSLAIPRVGCGLDKLNWKKVKILLELCFLNTDIQILVCNN